jgi:hypothetical protein
MLLPDGYKIDLKTVQTAINLYREIELGLRPSYVIVHVDVWTKLKNECISHGGYASSNPQREEMIIDGVKVLSSREVKETQLEVVKIADFTYAV